jgi:hypothetical protein
MPSKEHLGKKPMAFESASWITAVPSKELDTVDLGEERDII